MRVTNSWSLRPVCEWCAVENRKSVCNVIAFANTTHTSPDLLQDQAVCPATTRTEITPASIVTT
jgi:hypothetical protein